MILQGFRSLAGKIVSILTFLCLAAYATYLTTQPEGGYVHAVDCSIFSMADMPRQGLEHLLACSTLEQTIVQESTINTVIEPADVSGWQFIKPREPNSEAVVRVRVRRERPGEAVFYPRISGTASSVAVYDSSITPRAVLFRLQGYAPGWTPVGRQYLLPLACVRDGWKKDVFFMDITIVLQGADAQLWMRDGKILF